MCAGVRGAGGGGGGVSVLWRFNSWSGMWCFSLLVT